MRSTSAERTGAVALDYIERTAPIVLLLIDRKGSIVHANRYVSELVGEACVGQPLEQLLVGGESSPSLLAERRIAEDTEWMLNLKSATGLPQTLYFRAADCGEHRLLLGPHDMSELRHLQREQIALNRELGVVNRTLQKADTELVKLNALKNQFLGMAVHDSRRPAGVALNCSELLRETLSPEARKTFIPFFDWLTVQIPAFTELSDRALAKGPVRAGQRAF
ncbi:MAG: hypothetical protein GF330_00280 [Candidatus Eisenbacteria bacterium]|nr:hypothetical protein [Candidatus Eisenbacteria bacterium]